METPKTLARCQRKEGEGDRLASPIAAISVPSFRFVCEAWVSKRFPVFPCEESELDASHGQILRAVEVRTTLLSSGHKRKDSKCGGEAKEDHAMSNKR